MESNVVRGHQPPPPQKRMLVHRVTTTESQTFVVLSKAPYGQWVHWFGRRSHECTQDRANCKGCIDSWPVKWKAYLHCVTWPGRNEVFLEVTHTCFELMIISIPADESWRGLRMEIGRTKGGPKGRYLVKVHERKADGEKLPEEKDPLPTLRMLWRTKKGPLTQEIPIL